MEAREVVGLILDWKMMPPATMASGSGEGEGDTIRLPLSLVPEDGAALGWEEETEALDLDCDLEE
jgi:hypothetical protein